MDAQTAMMFGQQSSQPGGFPGSSQKASPININSPPGTTRATVLSDIQADHSAR